MGTAEATGNPEETPQTDSADLTPHQCRGQCKARRAEDCLLSAGQRGSQGSQAFPTSNPPSLNALRLRAFGLGVRPGLGRLRQRVLDDPWCSRKGWLDLSLGETQGNPRCPK